MAKSIDPRPLQNLVKKLESVSANAPRELEFVAKSARRIAVTEGGRAIALTFTIAQSRAKRDMRATNSKTSMTLTGRGRPVPASNFQGRQLKKKGYRFSEVRGKAITIKRGFTAARVKIPLMRKGRERTPLKGIFGPSIPDMLAKTPVTNRLDITIGNRMLSEVNRRIQKAVEKAAENNVGG